MGFIVQHSEKTTLDQALFVMLFFWPWIGIHYKSILDMEISWKSL